MEGFETTTRKSDSLPPAPAEDTDMEDESEHEDEGMDDDDSKLQNDIKVQHEAAQQQPQTSSQSPQVVQSEHSHDGAMISTSSQIQQTPPMEEWRPYVNPPNIGWVRQLLFELKEPVELSLDEFIMYWPFIDNIWVKQRSAPTRDGLHITDYYMCRLRRPTCKRHQSRPLPQGKKPRNKVVREGGTCNFQIRVVKFEGTHTKITISRGPSSSLVHTHDLDHIDKIKKNSGVMEYVRQEAARGYLPASIYAKLREDPVQLDAAGGRHLTTIDVRNISGKWRANNPGRSLRAHEGYAYQNGLGVYKIQDGSHPIRPPAIVPHPASANPSSDALAFPNFSLEFLQPYLPVPDHTRRFPHITITYASSMDGKISLSHGIQTPLSGPDAKLMTHYLRSRHDAILIGLGTAIADDPGLNCRLHGAGGFGGFGTMWQPRPVIIDPTGRWPVKPESRILKAAAEGKGKAPWVVVSPGAELHPEKLMLLKRYGGDFLRIREFNPHWRLRWEAIFGALANQGIRSIMVEGGGVVLSELLNPEYSEFIDSTIVTVTSSFLGRGGVGASPDSKRDERGQLTVALKPNHVQWHPLGNDVIMCGKIRIPPPPLPPPPILPGLEAAAAAQGNLDEGQYKEDEERLEDTGSERRESNATE